MPTKADVSFKVTKDGKAIGSMLTWLKTTNKTFMERAHVAAVSCILHVVYFQNSEGAYTGTTQVANQLCDVLSGDKRGNSLRKWFEAIGPMRWDNTTKTLKLHKTKADAMRQKPEAELSKELLNGITFWAFDPPKPYAGFDLAAEIAKLIKKAESTQEKVEEGEIEDQAKVKIDPELLSSLRKLAA